MMRSRLREVMAIARMLQAHLMHLPAHFHLPITNAFTADFNAKIQPIKADIRGFRSLASYYTCTLLL
jgi:transposase